MFKLFDDYLIIKRCDLNKLFNVICELKQDITMLTDSNKELKQIIINNKCECKQQDNNLLSCNDANNFNDLPDVNNEVQDILFKEYNLSLINDNGKKNKRYYFKSVYLFNANPKYCNLLNLKFNELMEHYNNNIRVVKPLLREYLEILKVNDFNKM